MAGLNDTHDPSRTSWVESANIAGADFPIQNLPFGLFRRPGEAPRGGVAIGDRVLDLAAALDAELFSGEAEHAARLAAHDSLNDLVQAAPSAVSALRARLSDLLSSAPSGEAARARADHLLVAAADVTLLRPVQIGAFTDFCCSIDHIRRFTGDGPLHPAWTALPVGYNGRASSVQVSGAPVVRPLGQFQSPPDDRIRFGPEPRLDFELEFGAYLSRGTEPGRPIAVAEAAQRLFGFSLVNDWSARGIQIFETLLGPHLGKSFATTVGPWIVTAEALAPFPAPARPRGPGEQPIPAHLWDEADQAHGHYGVELTAWLSTAAMREAGTPAHRLTRTRFEAMSWTLAQMVAHQASNGCPLEACDLIASGTVSGPSDEAMACLIEINGRGRRSLALADGETRTWLEDGDEIAFRGRAERDGFVGVGFGECAGRIAPSPALWKAAG